MTLHKQITLLFSSLLLVLLVVVAGKDLSRLGQWQQGQLQATARDTARTLGVAIGSLPDAEDPGRLAVLFDAVADDGYFQRIEFVAANGQTVHERLRTPDSEQVPDWFRNAVSLEAAAISAPVNRGNEEIGRLNVEVHPALAYAGLYRSMASTFLWSAALFVAAVILLWLALRHVMQPLQRVKQQADAIHNNQFIQQDSIPETPELKSVVEALNLMIARVQGIFDEQERTLNRYQQLLYRDKATNLGNRRYLLEQLRQSLSQDSEKYNCMAIVKVLDFEQLRAQHGYEASNRLVKSLSELLGKPQAGHSADCLSRFNDDEFAFLSTADEQESVEFVARMFEDFRSAIGDDSHLSDVRLVAGICDLQGDDEVGSVLSNVDYCLSQAVTRGPFSIEHQLSTSLDLPQGKMNWRNWLESMLESDDLYLVGQLAVSNDRIPVQRELFVRTRNDQDQVIPASAFMPMAASLGMSLEIDRKVFRLIMDNKGLDRRIPLAINLSAAFFERAEARDEFDQLLAECENRRTRLCVEASHHVLNQFPAMCGRISDRVRRHGHQFGIDNLNFGQSLQLLQSGQFDYVKIAAATLHEMIQNEMTASYQALRTMGDTLDIMIVAVAVDSQEVYNDLRELGIGIMQGYFLGPPEEV